MDDVQNLTPKKEAFLAAFRINGNVSQSAAAAEISRTSVYQWLESDEDFKAEFEDAREEAADRLEQEARRRAEEGVRKAKFYQGKPIMVPVLGDDGELKRDNNGELVMTPYVEHEYSDTLLIVLLKANRPEKFRENISHDHNLNNGFVGITVHTPGDDD